MVKITKSGSGAGGASLTALDRQLIRCYRDFEAEMQQRAAQAFPPLVARARPAPVLPELRPRRPWNAPGSISRSGP